MLIVGGVCMAPPSQFFSTHLWCVDRDDCVESAAVKRVLSVIPLLSDQTLKSVAPAYLLGQI